MMRGIRCLTLPLVATAVVIAFPDQRVQAKRAIPVSSVTELYAEINKVDNAGTRLVLSPAGSPYFLDPSKPHAGRLELQPDMELIGQAGDPEAVIIDASRLPPTSFPSGGGAGAVRMGQGTNVLEWLTVQNAVNANAAIETDLPPTSDPIRVRVAHVVSKGNTRGLDFRAVGAAMNGRLIEGTFEDNLLTDNLGPVGADRPEGQGMRIAVVQGVTGATVRAVLRGNRFEGNLAGLVALGLNSSGNAIEIDSAADRFTDNHVGCWLAAGNSTGQSANRNRLTFIAHGDKFEDNTKVQEGPWFAGGGLTVIGGWSGRLVTVANRTSDNTAHVEVFGSRFEGNQGADVTAYGAHGNMVLAGTNNRVELRLEGIKKDIVVTTVDSEPLDPADTNHVVLLGPGDCRSGSSQRDGDGRGDCDRDR